ncbi:Type II secretion system (T2SS), protein F [uncultured archaeon]|nr:Type II secretion system (T2SS), protein F [uncultured archaeon]
MTIEQDVDKIKEAVLKEKITVKEISSLFSYLKNSEDKQEKAMMNNQIEKLKNNLKETNNNLFLVLDGLMIQQSLSDVSLKPVQIKSKIPEKKVKFGKSQEKLSELERDVIKRLKKKKEKIVEKKEKKPNPYVTLANNLFSGYVKTIVKQKRLASLEKDLIKSNLSFTSVSYLSTLILTTMISTVIAFLFFILLLFFNIGIKLPIITPVTESIGVRMLEIFWIIIIVPAATLFFMYSYPNLEKKSLERRIEQELPFATIHMAAVAGSLIEPTKIFSIISSTGEYPSLRKEFNKLLNEINVYGYDLVTALKDRAVNSPSQKLSELFNGLATTITSGGDLFNFFDKRSQTLLFDYRLDKEKKTKSAETFMDIYISVVIAAPMILMLLLMMMKISGLGISLSTSTLTLLVVGGVSLINIFFLAFLQIKQPGAI